MSTQQSNSKLKGILKHIPDDFIVEEIDSSRNVLNINGNYSYKESAGDFLHIVMKKKNIDTISAIYRIGSKIGIRDGRINYAGVKDKVAISAQKISIYKIPVERITGLQMKDIDLYPIGRGSKVYLGDLWGNRFTICIRNINQSCNQLRDHVEKIVEKTNKIFPNFFGEQRFGSVRPVTCPVGLEILRGNISQAVELYICKVFAGENENISEVRRTAANDKTQALEHFPRSYIYERMMLDHLVAHDRDYYGAFMKLPQGLRRMFVNAVQSHVFNETLRMMIKDNICIENLRIPIVGYLYEKRIIEGVADKYINRILRKENIKPDMFRLRKYPELSSEGGHRLAFEKFHDFEIVSVKKDDIFTGKSKITLRFSLPKGCYATVFLSEFFDFA